MERSLALTVLDLLREHLIAVQYADSAYGTEISNIQASLLSEIVRRTDPTVEELSRILVTTVSTVSRQLTALSKSGHLSITKDSADARRNSYTLTGKGMQFIRLHWRLSEEFTQRGSVGLSPAERTDVEAFLQVLLGYDPRSELVALPHESTITLALRALAFVHGVLSDDFLGSGHSNRDWLVLSEILYNHRSPSQLSELLRTPPSTISIRLKNLEKGGLIVNERDTHDRRARILRLTQCGMKIVTTIESCAERVIGTPLGALEVDVQRRYLEAFSKYVRGVGAGAAHSWRADIVSPSDLPLLAMSAVSFIISCGARYRHSGYLLHPSNIVLRLSLNGCSPLLIELEPIGTSRARVVNVFNGTLAEVHISPMLLDSIIYNTCRRKLVRDHEPLPERPGTR
jgi:DNA-binding MarR family transcriptional regulator